MIDYEQNMIELATGRRYFQVPEGLLSDTCEFIAQYTLDDAAAIAKDSYLPYRLVKNGIEENHLVD